MRSASSRDDSRGASSGDLGGHRHDLVRPIAIWGHSAAQRRILPVARARGYRFSQDGPTTLHGVSGGGTWPRVCGGVCGEECRWPRSARSGPELGACGTYSGTNPVIAWGDDGMLLMRLRHLCLAPCRTLPRPAVPMYSSASLLPGYLTGRRVSDVSRGLLGVSGLSSRACAVTFHSFIHSAPWRRRGRQRMRGRTWRA